MHFKDSRPSNTETAVDTKSELSITLSSSRMMPWLWAAASAEAVEAGSGVFAELQLEDTGTTPELLFSVVVLNGVARGELMDPRQALGERPAPARHGNDHGHRERRLCIRGGGAFNCFRG